jgi:hypothetical protein
MFLQIWGSAVSHRRLPVLRTGRGDLPQGLREDSLQLCGDPEERETSQVLETPIALRGLFRPSDKDSDDPRGGAWGETIPRNEDRAAR